MLAEDIYMEILTQLKNKKKYFTGSSKGELNIPILKYRAFLVNSIIVCLQ